MALAALSAAVVSAQVIDARPLGVLAFMQEIDGLRRENASLKAQLIGRDRALANQRHRCTSEKNELQADLDQERLSARAAALLPDLREALDAAPGAEVDWVTGTFKPMESSTQCSTWTPGQEPRKC